MILYATTDDLTAWNTARLDLSSVDATGLLRSASNLVGEVIENAYYDVDDAGNPTDADVIEALKEATCTQVIAWIKLGIDPGTGGVSTVGVKTSVGIGSGRITYADAATAAAARSDAAVKLVPDAQRILRQAGLASTRVWTFG